MRYPILLICLFCSFFLSGCSDDDFSGPATPVLRVQVSAATCQNKIDVFRIRVEGAGVGGEAGPGDAINLTLTIGNHRLIANSVPPGIDYDQVYFVPAQGITVTLDCP
jgi:hypothetical protein